MPPVELTLSALADPSRREICRLLAAGEQPAHALLAHFGFSQPALSRHLRVLREAGLVEFVRQGREHRYRLRGEPLQSTARWMLDLHAFWESRLDALGDVLDELSRAERGTPRRNRRPKGRRRR